VLVLAHSPHRPRSGMAGAQFSDLRQKGLVEYPLQPDGKMWPPPVLISINIKLT
jgi:hypothetical protein